MEMFVALRYTDETPVTKIKLNLRQPILIEICQLAAKPDYRNFSFGICINLSKEIFFSLINELIEL